MHAARFLAIISAVVCCTSAAAVNIRWGATRNAAVVERRQANVTWTAENYIWGCSPGGCSARFNISAPEGYTSGAPGFNVVCSPIYIQQGWVPCRNPDNSPISEDSQVFSIWTAGADRDRQYLGVSHIYKNLDDSLTWNATAGTDFLPVTNMSIIFPVNTITAVGTKKNASCAADE
ncbi:hypothetical protein CGRA01v4_09340 [Colletotrichum graminicola]|uniref:Uncharacterized protein n=1 Tax=Colletotrichum graminicola (strain M1.001 / M2 / FGSC 10212) TaxID=645133 RepID=E3QPD5_COLGM|nr:uncharacterized protein GLRG_07867 [Colletotrichum graminicola M1.001]EFQ32723.1 hypothetical protein GLRG_07867 [Colletotrichum graminicola M1.001]WDK18055.1 hypothetical protein CGRA01v4_09340 [Colletotrichum graminicola]